MANLKSFTVRAAVLAKTNGRCWYCGCELSYAYSEDGKVFLAKNSYCIDHVVPLVRGGTNELENLVPACTNCNSVKRGKPIEKFREYLAWKQIGVKPFDDSQIEWLIEHSIELPQPPAITFYFEEMEGDL